MKKSEIGLIGLGVMGKSLSRNIAGRGISLSVYNREVPGSEESIAKNFVNAHDEMSDSQAFNDIQKFIESLAIPRKIFLMVNAGDPVDAVINRLTPLLDNGDIIIDGGNSHYKQTERRYHDLSIKNIRYIGTGVSGGEEGALKGPSIMPGGSDKAYNNVGPILQKIAAVDANGDACCRYIGKGGSGHFVKMVHNGIEYGEMQLIAEVYGILRFHMSKSTEEISSIFNQWNETECASYLLEITADILTKKEQESNLIDIILDRAGNKGTGSWTTIAACELGVAIPTLTAALYARYQSAPYDARQEASQIYPSIDRKVDIEIETIRKAYQMARIINHHQGYALIAAASDKYNWEINFNDLSMIWTNGCIIRSKLMEKIAEHIGNEGDILMNKYLNESIINDRALLNELVSKICLTNISAPCLTSVQYYLNAFSQKQSLANIIQAQRDYFGAHTYERKDKERGEKFHTEWMS